MSSNRILLEFGPAFEAGPMGVEQLRFWTAEQEELRLQEALRQAYNAGCGLLIHKYEYHVEYYLDFSMGPTELYELTFNGE